MSAFDRWLNREIAREERAVYLEDALLNGRFMAYACYRLRFFLGRSLVEAALHIIEFTFLAFIFKQHMLVSALLIRATSGFLSAWWWGALENMRGHVRDLHREGKTRFVPKVLARWFGLALIVSAALLVLTIGWAFLDSIRPGRSFEVFHLYVLAVVFRLVLGVLGRTFHSAVYAIRRIYRPFFAIVGVELLGFAATLLLWPSCGVWSFPLAQIPTGIVAAILTFTYVARVYRFLGFQPLPWRSDRGFKGVVPRRLTREFFMAGWAYGFMQLDYVLVVSLFYGAHQSSSGFRLFIFFYLIGPFIRAGYEWAQLFYFDLKRLELDLFSYFKRRFTRMVRGAALAMGVLFWVLTSVCGTLLVQQNLGMVYGLLLLFFLVRSQLAFNQIRAFAEQRYGVLVWMGIMIVAGVWLARWAVSAETERLALFAVVLLAAVICLGINSAFGIRLDRRSRMLSLPDWLARLQKRRRTVRLRVVTVDYKVGNWLVERIGRDILRRVRAGAMTRIGHRRIAWYEARSGAHPSPDAEILEFGGGLIEAIQSSPYVENGGAAISWAEQNGVIEMLPTRGRPEEQAPPYSTAEIKRRFQRMFKKGVVYDALERNPTPLTELSRSERRQLMAGAIQYSKNLFKRIRKGPFDVTTLCDQGRIRLIFGAPQSAAQSSRKKWKSFINRVNLSYALHATTNNEKDNDMKPIQLKPAAVWSMALAAPILMLGMIPFEDRITGDLVLKPEERTQLYAPLAGFVREIPHREGDSISAGDVIARFEIPDLASRISQKEAEVKEIEAMYQLLQTGPRPEELAEQQARVERAERWHDKAQQELQKAIAEESEQVARKIEERTSRLEFAEEEHDRARNLYEADVLSRGEYERAQRELRVTEAQKKQALAEERARQAVLILETESDLVQRERELAEARATLKLMEAGTRPELLEAKKAELERVREELAYLEKLETDQVLRTPIAGVVTTPDMSTKKGTFLKEGELFCEVVDPSRLKAEIAVPDRAAARVQVGQPIDLKVRALPYQTLRAPVGQVAPVLDAGEANPTARIYCWLNNPDRELRPGMSGYARVHLGSRSLGAVLLDRMSRFVRREFWW